MNQEHFLDRDNRIRYTVLTLCALSLVIFGLIVDGPTAVLIGLEKIIKEPGLLITDYIGLAGVGATFVNSGLLTLMMIFLLYRLKLKISGVSVAALFLIAGFAMFGKNIFNVWLILLGVFLYSRIQKDKFSKYIYIALFGTSLAPAVSEMIFSINQPIGIRLLLGVIVGVTIGIILPPLSAYLLRVHQGFNLYNIGFTAGIIGTIYVSILQSYGFSPSRTLIWSYGNNGILSVYLVILFVGLMGTGFIINGKSFKKYKNVISYSGRLVCDLVQLEGFGVTLINMGLNGFIGMSYVLLVGGELNGPTIGGILTMVGFGAFGKHPKNVTPTLIGVFLGSITKILKANDPAMLLAALFGTALAPISGQFGWVYGVLAGFINSSVVLYVGVLHGGLNLYNTGFAAGIVAAFMIPIIEAFKKEDE